MDTTKPRTPSMPQTANLTADVARARATREAATAQVLAMRNQLTQQALNDALERIDVAYAATVRDNASLSAGAAHNRHAQALKAIVAGGVDAVILDIVLPGRGAWTS